MSKGEFRRLGLPLSGWWIFQWRDLLMPWKAHWVCFDVVRFYMEYDKADVAFEIVVTLLGLGFGLRFELPWTTKEHEQMIKAFEVEKDKLQQVGEVNGIKVMAPPGMLDNIPPEERAKLLERMTREIQQQHDKESQVK